MLPDKASDLSTGESLGVKPPIGFNTPAQIGAIPRRESMSPGRKPQEPEHPYLLLLAEGWSLAGGAGLA